MKHLAAFPLELFVSIIIYIYIEGQSKSEKEVAQKKEKLLLITSKVVLKRLAESIMCLK